MLLSIFAKIAPFTLSSLPSCPSLPSRPAITATEEIEPVADVKHSVSSNSVYLPVGPAIGIDIAREVGLLVQDVVPLKHHHQLLSAQEAMGKLGVPDYFIGVQRLVAISSLAVYVDVCAQGGFPGEGDLCVSAIGNVPGREVA